MLFIVASKGYVIQDVETWLQHLTPRCGKEQFGSCDGPFQSPKYNHWHWRCRIGHINQLLSRPATHCEDTERVSKEYWYIWGVASSENIGSHWVSELWRNNQSWKREWGYGLYLSILWSEWYHRYQTARIVNETGIPRQPPLYSMNSSIGYVLLRMLLFCSYLI